jgi:Arc/MetJ-type ribon-helix-helix transcriptional regulator
MSDKNESNPFIGFRIPPELHEQALQRIEGTYSSLSEYLRDLVRRDTASLRDDPAGSSTPA